MTPDLEGGIGCGEEGVGGVEEVAMGLAAVVVDGQHLHAERSLQALVARVLPDPRQSS